MPDIPITLLPGAYAAWKKITTTAADAGGDQFAATGKEILLIHNSGSGSVVVTINAAVDKSGRSAPDCVTTVGAGLYSFVGPLYKIDGWATAAGAIQLATDTAADTSYAVLRIVDEG